MPIFEYKCDECETIKQILTLTTKPIRTTYCPHCDTPMVTIISITDFELNLSIVRREL